MTTTLLQELIEKADTLPTEEQWQLANHLVTRVLHQLPGAKPRRNWSEIRGLAKPSLFGEDAQTYISRTRREGDEQRERVLRGDM